jgi:hypothetical protein
MLQIARFTDLLKKACANSIQSQVLLYKRLDEFQAAGGDLTRINGMSFLDAMINV